MNYLTVYTTNHTKTRVGSATDGGYVVLEGAGLTYDCLLSCGISDNIDFEIDFLQRHPNVPCHAFDGTVEGLPQPHPSIHFVKQNIGHAVTATTTNMHTLLETHRDIFLKMDIETYEFPWLLSLKPKHFHNIKQIVMEFHFPFTEVPHIGYHMLPVDKMRVFQLLAETHDLVHLHGNNCCGTVMYEGIVVPNVFECTFIRKTDHVRTGLSADPIPGPLDKINVPTCGDIYLNWPPFVHPPYTQTAAGSSLWAGL